jgi:PP-loop superfamily ATP-utilizing enzyme
MQAHQASGNVQPRLATVLSNIGGPLAVAVSGGVGSVTLATFAHRADGSRVEIFHAVSPAVPREASERIRIGSRTTKEANWAATPRLFVAHRRCAQHRLGR